LFATLVFIILEPAGTCNLGAGATVMTSVFLCVLCTVAQAPDSRRIPVVLTTDCGVEVDDQWALTHLAVSPRIELRAVVTTHAPGHSSAAAEASARSVLDLLTLPKKPAVVAGSSRPLASRKAPIPNAGVDLILKETRDGTREHRVKLLAIGAATDVASALLIDPTLGDRVEVVAMGFDSWPEGRDPWNVKNDVKAWQVVLESQVPLVVGDSAVCKRFLSMTPETAHRFLDPCGAAGKALANRLDAWLGANGPLAARETGSKNAWPIWDEVTTAYLLGLTEQDEHPRPKLRDDLTFDHAHPHGTVRWIRSVKTEALWDDLSARIRDAKASGR
jgi:inosine-uridine nucleoside N-ribohydrolase